MVLDDITINNICTIQYSLTPIQYKEPKNCPVGHQGLPDNHFNDIL